LIFFNKLNDRNAGLVLAISLEPMRPTITYIRLLAFPLAVALLSAACGDFADFDRRRSLQTTQDPDRRIIINPGGYEDGGMPTPGQDGGLPAPSPDAGTPPPPTPDSGVTPSPTPDTGPVPPTGQCGMTTFEEQVFQLVNQERQKQGLPAYACDAKAVLVARNYSKLMCDTGHFSHYGPDGSTPWSRLKAGGVSFQTAGENIAAGQSTPQSVMNSWMNSSGHRANILSSSFAYIGVGYDNCGKGYNHYWTQNFFK
jgi:uncharacterized protein YkwD